MLHAHLVHDQCAGSAWWSQHLLLIQLLAIAFFFYKIFRQKQKQKLRTSSALWRSWCGCSVLEPHWGCPFSESTVTVVNEQLLTRTDAAQGAKALDLSKTWVHHELKLNVRLVRVVHQVPQRRRVPEKQARCTRLCLGVHVWVATVEL
jgi:hypothetical protein